MKQSSTTAGRGRKKSSGRSSSGSRGATAGQHRSGSKSSVRSTSGSSTRSSGQNSGSSSRSSSSSSRGSGSDSSGRSSGSANRSNTNRSNANRSNAGTNTMMRGNTSSNTAGRNREETRTSGVSHQQHFQGDSYLEKFFLDQLQDVYYAEHKITEALPKMMEAATTENLTDAFDDHLHQTQRHIKRLEKVFESLGKRAEGKKCEAIEGISREIESIIDETEDGSLTRDAALIIAAQKVEHYEIATYGGLVQLAITMQLHEAADLLDKTLVEEEDTDALLTEIAENDINLMAEHEGNEYSWEATMIYETEGGEEGNEEQEEQGEGGNEENENEETETTSAK